MYGVLGDGDAQEEIRKANPDNYHCSFLRRHSPAFCECLTIDIEGAEDEVFRKGTICPNNPYYINKELFEDSKLYIPLLNAGYYYKTRIELNQVPAIEDMTPEDFIVYSIMNGVSRREIAESQAGASMSMFSGTT